MDHSSVIVTRDLVMGYARHPLVSGMTLNIQPGEFIGIFGPNGAGKSTFLRSILGLLKPLAGEILVFGKAPQCGNAKIGYMPQMRTLNPIVNFTGRTLLAATAYAGSHSAKDIQQMIELVNAESYIDRPFPQLSGGERQRIYLAQALLGYPQLLLLDEPLSNLDPRYQEAFIHLLHDIQKKLQVTILFTAHDPNPLLQVMDRVLYFAQGKAVIGHVHEIMTSETLTKLYETPIEVFRHQERLIVIGEDRCGAGHHD